MSELAPGVYVHDWVPRGKVFRLRPALLGLDGGPEHGLAIHPDDWARVPPAARERFLDAVTRDDATRGIREVERYLEQPVPARAPIRPPISPFLDRDPYAFPAPTSLLAETRLSFGVGIGRSHKEPAPDPLDRRTVPVGWRAQLRWMRDVFTFAVLDARGERPQVTIVDRVGDPRAHALVTGLT